MLNDLLFSTSSMTHILSFDTNMTSSSRVPLNGRWRHSAGPPMLPAPPSHPPPAPPGLGRVVRRASDYPEAFHTYTFEHCSQVEELPLGTIVLVLAGEPADVGWAPILVANSEADCHNAVRFTWHHPQCIELLESCDLGGPIVVGHSEVRGRKHPKPPSHPLRPKAPCGVRRMEDKTLLLEARWPEDNQGQRDTVECSGWCASVCVETASQPRRVAHILNFASWCENGCIVCEHAKHRSLSAAVILELFFHRTVDYKHASGNHPCPCGQPAARNIARISAAFRSLENDTQPRNLLSVILGLPSFVS